MNIKTILCSALAIGLLSGCACGRHCHENKQARIQAQAKITRADAEKIALAQAPTGTVKEAEIEKEHGKLIWSFDLTTPGTSDITEVNIDAITGKVIGVEKEAAEKEDKSK
jgi:uncharacterized membrane protein YkoI